MEKCNLTNRLDFIWNIDETGLLDTTPGSAGTVTESGWSNSIVFLEFVKHIFESMTLLARRPCLFF
ncbi:hypothetical protein DPMN_082361 [Dreissena polymorpha]|uniref:Uncharacterized protein n=1 Tax=Dreissena polymorpha TaxID=45954 RepID=A0A9D3Y6T9_DREPO|nr:hypothetical protein DPMN_082361 [Dreissena polymorpha]